MQQAMQAPKQVDTYEAAIFNWSTKDKYTKLQNLELEVRNILMTKNYDIRDAEQVPII